MGKNRTRHARKGRPIPVSHDEEAPDEENGGEALSGAGREASGSLPGSVGGTTGTGGENAGISSPGADVPAFPGISPGEAERLRHKRG